MPIMTHGNGDEPSMGAAYWKRSLAGMPSCLLQPVRKLPMFSCKMKRM